MDFNIFLSYYELLGLLRSDDTDTTIHCKVLFSTSAIAKVLNEGLSVLYFLKDHCSAR